MTVTWGDTGRPVERDPDGQLPHYVWPGGYPLVYLTESGDTVCPECAGKEDTSDPAVCATVHWEGVPETCTDCGKSIPSAYGEVPE